MDEPHPGFVYVGPNGQANAAPMSASAPPAHTRIVAISDTVSVFSLFCAWPDDGVDAPQHNQHHTVVVPMGDVLVHAGDVLTESGLRHVKEAGGGKLVAKKKGIELVHEFARWFGAQPHPFKVLIGGNHDKVLEALGAQAVRDILNEHCKVGTVACECCRV